MLPTTLPKGDKMTKMWEYLFRIMRNRSTRSEATSVRGHVAITEPDLPISVGATRACSTLVTAGSPGSLRGKTLVLLGRSVLRMLQGTTHPEMAVQSARTSLGGQLGRSSVPRKKSSKTHRGSRCLRRSLTTRIRPEAAVLEVVGGALVVLDTAVFQDVDAEEGA